MSPGNFRWNKIKPSFTYPVLWIIISTVLLTIPGNDLPQENWLNDIWFDKWVHIGMFSIMVTLWCWSLQKKTSDGKHLSNIYLWTGLACLVYGAGMEFVQKYFIPNRSFDVNDIIADGFGCSLGVIYATRKFIKK